MLDKKERWAACELAAKEQDAKKLIELMREINSLLDVNLIDGRPASPRVRSLAIPLSSDCYADHGLLATGLGHGACGSENGKCRLYQDSGVLDVDLDSAPFGGENFQQT
jgi:hypothetical protein